MKGLVFAKRTFKEILRDPLSYIFCLGFPLIMLIIMTIVNKSVPKEAGLEIFALSNLTPSVAFFGLSFIMVFACIQVAGDRTTSLIMRLHASPMKSNDFCVGYTIPLFLGALLQIVVTYLVAIIVGVIIGENLNIAKLMLSMIYLLPGALLFIGLGLLFGTVFNEKAAPGASSAIITIAGMLGGIWMPVDSLGGTILNLAKATPFYHGVKSARAALSGDMTIANKEMLITMAWAVVIYVVGIVVMSRKLKKDVI